MESLSNQLYTCVSTAFDQFITQAANELSIDRSKLLDIWNRTVSSELKVKPVVLVAPTSTRGKSKVDSDAKQCAHIGTRGKSKGEQCSTKASPDSIKGFCKKHMKGEAATSPKKAEQNSTSSSTANNKTLVNPAINTIKVDSLPIKVNKFGNYQNSSGIVFDRSTHEAYGRQSDDGKVIPLSADDIRECKQFGFKFRMPEQLKSKDDEGDEEVEDVEEVEEEVEEEDE